MARTTLVPITPSVLTWAIDESGLSRADIAKAVGVSQETVRSWEAGIRPGLTQLRKLATQVRRAIAVFLLPEPPKRVIPTVSFRATPGETPRELNPAERRAVRQARRVQEMLSWLVSELKERGSSLPSATTSDEPERAASIVRTRLGIPPDRQLNWESPAEAFDAWRGAFEEAGIAVFAYSMGSNSCRGFSLSDDLVPLVAVNTAWNTQARIYTLFHELGHLVTGTSAMCANPRKRRLTGESIDPVERWCEEFAAAALLPWKAVQSVTGLTPHHQVLDLAAATVIARRFKVSLRAATLLLIRKGLAEWGLYEKIPARVDDKSGGGGGGGRQRSEIKSDQFGPRTGRLFYQGWERDVISRSTILDYLDIPDHTIEQLSVESGELTRSKD